MSKSGDIESRPCERVEMKKRFTEEQIVAILRDGQAGQKTVEELCRAHGVSQPTY